jgi:tRNA U34 5-carboxymethylaminomethyl modifying GTPase MnmE/TrmE
MATTPRQTVGSAVSAHRRRLRSRGLMRLEVQVHGEDAALVRAVAAALADPARAAEARALLRGRFPPTAARSLKDLLASAPLDDVDLERSRDTGRAVDL